MRKIKIFIQPIIVASMVLFSGCEKYLDVNANLNSPTAVPISTLLTSAQQRIGGVFALGSVLGNGLGVYTHQLMQYGGYNRYGIAPTGTSGSWNTLYQIVTNLDVVIEQATANEQYTYAGIGKVLKAYTVSQMVDIWGDIPFSEFNQFKAGITQPKFDDDAQIYPQLITMLNEGIADLQNTAPQVKPGNDDLVYKGNSNLWIKAANTIKLKLYTQVRLVQNVSSEVSTLLANPASLINSQAESFLFPYGPFTSTDDRYPGYGDYSAAQRGGQIPSHWMYEIMKGKNPGINTGLTDPRIPYYFYNQKSGTAAPENCTDYRDGGFITLIFGSNSRCVGGSNSNTYTLLGIYPIGGRYDDGTGQIIGASAGVINAGNAGTGAAPQRALTYADRLFLEAELINAGMAQGDQSKVFSDAVKASFAQVDYVITNLIKPSQEVPAIATSAATTTYVNGVVAAFDAAGSTKKLEHIMTQKWLSRFGNSVDNYTDYRRTGFPVMFSPAPIGSVTSVDVPGRSNGEDAWEVPVSNGTAYPLSLPYPQQEINQNSNAAPQKAVQSYKIFWMP